MSTQSLQETLEAAGYAKVIVALRPAATATSNALSAEAAAAASSSLQNHFIVPSEGQAESLAASASRLSGRRAKRPEPEPRRVRIYPHLGLAIGYVDEGGAAALAADARVGAIEKAPELSLIRPVAARPTKLSVSSSWGVERLHADRLWAAGYTGKGVLVGHLDTGVDASHPALQGAVAAFAEFDLLGDQVPKAKPWDSADHGTHTAGTIAGRAVQRRAFGVAPEAQLASAMVIEGGQVIDRILAGLEWVVEQECRILSMSLGLRGFTPAFQVVIDALRAANVLPVIAVGNEFANTSRSPGNYANVLSVGAMDATNRVADFSSSQRFNRPSDPLVPDLVAPGVEILSCVPGNAYAEMDGSSMATPHVAGLAALLLQARPESTVDDLEAAILGSCMRPASMSEARANRGVPDAVRAFSLLTGAALPAAARKAKRVAPKRGGAPKREAPSKREKMPVARKTTGQPKKAGPTRRRS